MMTEIKMIPKIRFPFFEGSWQTDRIENISRVLSGGTPSRSEKNYWRGNIPWVSTSLINFNIIIEAEEYITQEGLNNSATKIFPSGTIVMAMYGQGKTRGKVAILGIDASTNQACAAFLINSDKIDSIFLYHILACNYENIRNLSNQGGQQNLSGELIKSFRISFPLIPEQQKIATFLTAIDRRMTILTQQKKKLEQYKDGVMQKLFSQELRFKDENGNKFPDWEEKTMGEIGNTYNGLTGKTKADFVAGKPYIQYKQIFDSSKLDTSKFDFVTINDGENQNKAQYGDIFFTTSSETPEEIGTSSVLLDHVEEVYLNSFCFGFRPNSLDELVPKFAQYFFRSEIARNEIIKLAQGSTRYNMSKVELMKISFAFPKKAEQQKIASFLTTLDAKIEMVTAEIKGSKAFKQGLLQKMFV